MWLNKSQFFTIVNSNRLPQSTNAQYLIDTGIFEVSEFLYISKRYRKCNAIQILEPNKDSYSTVSLYHFQLTARERMEEICRHRNKSSKLHIKLKYYVNKA